MHVDLDRTCHHYRLYDRDGVLLYSGSTFNLKQRMAEHAAHYRNRWWPRVARVESDAYPTQWQALLAERSAGVGECGKTLAGIGRYLAAAMDDDELIVAANHPAYANLNDLQLAKKWRVSVDWIRAHRDA